MQKQTIFPTNIESKLPDRFQKGKTFNITNGTADFGENNIDIVASQTSDRTFDFVGNVRNDLYRLSAIHSFAFAVEDIAVNFTGRPTAVFGERAVCKAFVVSQIEVGFGAVVENIDFTVLGGTHHSRINIQIGIEFLHADVKTACFEEHTERGGGESFAE